MTEYQINIVMYKYNARLIRVIDGSTIDANIDLGFGVFVKQRIRLFGIRCPDPKNKDDADEDKKKTPNGHAPEDGDNGD